MSEHDEEFSLCLASFSQNPKSIIGLNVGVGVYVLVLHATWDLTLKPWLHVT